MLIRRSQWLSGVHPNGNVVLTSAVDGMVGDSLSNGSGLRVLKRDFGVKPFTGQ
jgi:hypothetical protein